MPEEVQTAELFKTTPSYKMTQGILEMQGEIGKKITDFWQLELTKMSIIKYFIIIIFFRQYPSK